MEEVVEPDKNAGADGVKKPAPGGDRESFYIKMQNKVIDLRKKSNTYLNHAPKSEKYGLCQRIRNLEDELFGLLIEARKRYWNKTSLTKLDIAHEQLKGYWRLFYELGYFDYRHGEKEEQTASNQAERRFKVINVALRELGPMINFLIQAAKVKAKERVAEQAKESDGV